MMLRLYCDSIIRPILRQELTKEQYDKVCERLKNCPKVDAIPEAYIENFARKRDPVYQSNLSTLIACYHRETGDGHDESKG